MVGVLVGGSARADNEAATRREVAERFVEKWATVLSIFADPLTAFQSPAIRPQHDSTFVVAVPNTSKIELRLTFESAGLIRMSVNKPEPKMFVAGEFIKEWVQGRLTEEDAKDGLLDKISKKVIGLAFDQVKGADVATVGLNVLWVIGKAQEAFLNSVPNAKSLPSATAEESPVSKTVEKKSKKAAKQQPDAVVPVDGELARGDLPARAPPSPPPVLPGDEPATPSPSGDYCYGGAHPVGDQWEAAAGPHQHAEPPFDMRLFAIHEGCYYFVGDPGRFGYAGQLYRYFGEHPLGDGNWCFNDGPHTHNWQPLTGDFRIAGNWYYWAGTYDAAFVGSRHRYAVYYSQYYPERYAGAHGERPTIILANPTWTPPTDRPSPSGPVAKSLASWQQSTPAAGWRTPSPAQPPATGWRSTPPSVQPAAPAPAWRATQPYAQPAASATGALNLPHSRPAAGASRSRMCNRPVPHPHGVRRSPRCNNREGLPHGPRRSRRRRLPPCGRCSRAGSKRDRAPRA